MGGNRVCEKLEFQEVKLIIVDSATRKYNGFNLTADTILVSVECERGVNCSEALSGAN